MQAEGLLFELEVSSSQLLLERLESGGLACCLVKGRVRRPALREIPILSEDLVLVATPALSASLKSQESFCDIVVYDTDRINAFRNRIDRKQPKN